MGLKWVHLLKIGQKVSRSKFIGTTGLDDQKMGNPVLYGTYHPKFNSTEML